MTQHTDDNMDPLKALREELAGVTPSPEFAARVRQRVHAAEEARGASWFSGWRWLVPTAGVAAVVIVAVALPRPRPIAPEQAAVKAQVEAQRPLATSEAAVVSSPATATVSRAASPNFAVRTSNSGRQDAKVEAAIVEAPFPEVITNQPAILRALWARFKAEMNADQSATSTAEVLDEIVVSPVEVNPVFVKWMVEPPQTPGVLPIIRRVTADMAERSTK